MRQEYPTEKTPNEVDQNGSHKQLKHPAKPGKTTVAYTPAKT